MFLELLRLASAFLKTFLISQTNVLKTFCLCLHPLHCLEYFLVFGAYTRYGVLSTDLLMRVNGNGRNGDRHGFIAAEAPAFPPSLLSFFYFPPSPFWFSISLHFLLLVFSFSCSFLHHFFVFHFLLSLFPLSFSFFLAVSLSHSLTCFKLPTPSIFKIFFPIFLHQRMQSVWLK